MLIILTDGGLHSGKAPEHLPLSPGAASGRGAESYLDSLPTLVPTTATSQLGLWVPGCPPNLCPPLCRGQHKAEETAVPGSRRPRQPPSSQGLTVRPAVTRPPGFLVSCLNVEGRTPYPPVLALDFHPVPSHFPLSLLVRFCFRLKFIVFMN